MINELFFFLMGLEFISTAVESSSKHVSQWKFYDHTNRSNSNITGLRKTLLLHDYSSEEVSFADDDDFKILRKEPKTISPELVSNTLDHIWNKAEALKKSAIAAFNKAKELKLCRIMLRLNRSISKGSSSLTKLSGLIHHINLVDDTPKLQQVDEHVALQSDPEWFIMPTVPPAWTHPPKPRITYITITKVITTNNYAVCAIM